MNSLERTLVLVVLLFVAANQGCGSSSSSSAVTIRKINAQYYKVDIDMQAVGHYDMGRLYALALKNGVADFESQASEGLKAMVELMQKNFPLITFEEIIERAQTIFPNIPAEYQDEIRGMQSVFSGTDDDLNSGRLSQNKMLVYQLGPDVMRIVSCSASAAFGSGTASGKTVVGRNLEWHDATLPALAALQSVTLFHEGGNSVALLGFLGQLFAISGFNASAIFGSILDSDVGVMYVLDGDERSYPMDLRYGLEHQTTLDGVAGVFGGRDYAYDFNIFLADRETSAVLEFDAATPFSGLRTSTSALKTDGEIPIKPWNFSNAIACVNWFSLPGTVDNTGYWEGNAARWETFIELYGQYLAAGPITMDVMKVIMGYPGPAGDGKGENGAIWRYEDIESEVQSIVMNMDTFETWVSFQPAGQAPLRSPNYVQVFTANPF